MSFYEESHWSVRNRRFLLTVLSLLAPELMVLWACKQWLGSLAIKEQINEIIAKDEHIQDDPNRKGAMFVGSLIIYRYLMVTLVKKWTAVHAHFLQMGGFKVVFTDAEREDFNNELECKHEKDHWECVVRSDTFQRLLREGHINLPDITEDEINDKRKVDNVSKGLALLQLVWFIAQILARAFQRLAITQLEITTAALATMNFVMYYFWWHKPLNAQYPVMIHSIGVHERMNTKSHDEVKSRNDRKTVRSKAVRVVVETDGMTKNHGGIKAEESNKCGSKEDDFDRHGFLLSKRRGEYTSRLWCAIDLVIRTCGTQISGRLGYCRTCGRQISRRVGNCSRRMGDYTSRLYCAVDLVIRTCGISKVHVPWLAPIFVAIASIAFAMANAALVVVTISLVVALPLDEIHRSAEVVTSHHTKTSKLYSWAIKLPGLSHMPDSIHYVTKVNRSLFYSEHAKWSSRLFGVVAVLAGSVFGAIHCLAWNFDFPSRTEENIWRISSVVMIGVNVYVAVGVSALIKLRDCITGTLKFLFPEADLHCSYTLIAEEDALIFLSIIFSSIIHAIARIALIVLAVMSFSHLPPSAFEAIGWSDLIPHI